MTDNDRITALEARMATLEAVPPCACLDCQALRKRRIAESAILQQLAIERAPDAIAKVRGMSPRDQAIFWQRAAPARAIELLTSPEVTEEERARWTPVKLRDRLELELIELPDRVRVRLVAANLRYTPSHIVVDDDTARKLQAVGLGARLVRVHDVIEFVPLQVTKDFPPPVVERRQLDAMLKIDTRLRDCIVTGEMVVEQLSDQENKLIEAQLWRDLDWSDRPRRARKKITPPAAPQGSDQRNS